jgi:hypothetical protein
VAALQAVTAADIQRVMKQYFKDNHRVVIYLQPREKSGGNEMRNLLRKAECGMRISWLLVLFGALALSTLGQIPEPGPSKSVNVRAVKERN